MIVSLRSLKRYIARYGLARVAAKLVRSMQPAIGIVTAKAPEESLPTGTSKFGGHPDLPREVSWPRVGRHPLSFLGQLQLAEIQTSLCKELLPPRGLLSFFYDARQSAWGFDPDDRECWRVYYFCGDREALQRRPVPEKKRGVRVFNTCRLTFRDTFTLPDWSHLDRYDVFLTDRELKSYFRVRDVVISGPEGYFCHRLFGHPDVLQCENMEEECQLASAGIYCGRPSAYRTPEAKQLKEGASSWRLLLQLDSSRDAGWEWNDVGILYFWIRREDLEARRFERAWVILQSG